MPTAVMDAFKNLIRHGKHAKAAAAQATTSKESAASSSTQYSTGSQPSSATAAPAPPAKDQTTHAPPSPTKTRQNPPKHIDLPNEQEQPRVTQNTEGNVTFKNQPPISTPYGKEAEMIVQEEQKAKNKIPSYKGLERFRLLEKMGDGAFSNVYKALDLTTGEKVAVKVVRKFELNASQEGNKHLNPNFKKKPRATERANILKEVQIMRGINHPSVVKLISFSESDEHYFLVLELMEGGELFHQIVKLTYFSEHLARHVILQVAKGIRYLHEERGVVHRDIKPENILFERIPIIPSRNPIARPYDEEKEDEGEFLEGIGGGGIGRVKIADFGLSKVVWDEQTMTPCGTVGYTAPEIVKDERYSKSVDMWALGCVLYTLLCGFPPFYDESINVLTEKVARGYYTFLSPWWDDISHSAKDLITHLLCVNPEQRYTIDEFLAHPWCREPKGQVLPTPALITPSMPLDSPLLAAHKNARDVRSPGLATLKEAFDITLAVHRMEEEGNRRGKAQGFLGGLNEESGEEEEEGVVEEVAKKHGQAAADVIDQRRAGAPVAAVPSAVAGNRRQVAVASNAPNAYGNRRVAADAVNDGRAGTRDQGRRRHRNAGAGGGFELDLGNATLLGRRRKVAEPSPLAQGYVPPSAKELLAREARSPPGSPMRIG